MKYIIEGQPIPLARPRISGRHCYDSQKQYKLAYGIMLQNQHGDQKLFEKPLHLDAVFYFKKPLANMNRQTSRLKPNKQYKEDGTAYASKPDLDNLAKFLLDVCNGILFRDDCLVASMTIKKVYGDISRTEFELWEI